MSRSNSTGTLASGQRDLVNDLRSASQDGSTNLATPPNNVYQTRPQTTQPQGLTYAAQDLYQTQFQQNQIPGHHSTLPSTGLRSQGLTNLMEAALAPQDTPTFTPLENTNPLVWDGFMRFGEGISDYMGSYDADMSWTLDYLPPEESPNYLLDNELINAFDDFGDNPYQFQALQYEPPPALPDDTNEEDEEDTTDWPDKIAKPGSVHKQAPRIVPVRHSLSWQLVSEEAMASGFSPATIRPLQSVNNELRENFLSALNGPDFRNEISRPEISEAMFPPPEVLDFFIRLYVRFIHPRFPVVHLPTFDIYNTSPLLLITMMFLGSSHSTIDRGRFSRLFHEHMRIAIIRIQEIDKKYVSSPLLG